MYNCRCGKVPQELYFTEVKTMDFFANLINNIYTLVIKILESCGIVFDHPEELIPTDKEEA